MKTFVGSLQTEGEIFAINTRRMYNIYLNSRGANEKSEERELPFLEFHEKYLFSGGFRWTESNSIKLNSHRIELVWTLLSTWTKNYKWKENHYASVICTLLFISLNEFRFYFFYFPIGSRYRISLVVLRSYEPVCSKTKISKVKLLHP